MCIEHTYAGDKLVPPLTRPFQWVVLRADFVRDCNVGCWRHGPRHDVAENSLLSSSTACALEDADVAGLPGGVVAVNNGEVRPESESLAFRKGIDAAVMKYGQERDWWSGAVFIWQVIPGE